MGIVAELVLILFNFVLPESWLSVEVLNFTLVTHFPVLLLMETGLGETAPTAILALLAGLAVMS